MQWMQDQFPVNVVTLAMGRFCSRKYALWWFRSGPRRMFSVQFHFQHQMSRKSFPFYCRQKWIAHNQCIGHSHQIENWSFWPKMRDHVRIGCCPQSINYYLRWMHSPGTLSNYPPSKFDGPMLPIRLHWTIERTDDCCIFDWMIHVVVNLGKVCSLELFFKIMFITADKKHHE